jgi:hypothetical protein
MATATLTALLCAFLPSVVHLFHPKGRRTKKHINQQESLVELAQKIDHVLQKWPELGVLEKRGIAQMFIERIVVTQTEKYRVADVEIHWKDETVDEFILPWSSKTWTLWLPEEVETLRQLLDRKATQEEMSAALPKRNWRAIRIKIYEVIGKRSFYISPKPIRDEETYADYIERMERTGWKPPRKSGSRWVQEEIGYLEELLDEGATQLELCAALPHRSWAKIRKRITQLRGKDFTVEKPQKRMGKHETIEQYLERHPEEAVTMHSSISKNSPRQKPANSECHRSHRLNLAKIALPKVGSV